MKKLLILTLFLTASLWSFSQKRNYLLYTEANISELKTQVSNDSEMKQAWELFEQKVDKIMQKESCGYKEMEDLSLMYRMTHDEGIAQRIKETILREIKNKTWEDKGLLQRDPPWNAGLNTAHHTFSYTVGYDCIYQYLSNDERQTIAQGLVRLGIHPIMNDWINPTTNIHTFDTMGHNWWTGVVNIGGLASLAVRDEIPEAKEWAQIISNVSVEWFNYSGSVLQNKIPTFDRNGGMWESINYANFGVSQYLMFRLAFQNVMSKEKLPEIPILNKIADFFINTTYYTDSITMSVNFGDSYFECNGHASALLLWNLGYHDERIAWYLNKTNHRGTSEMMTKEHALGLLFNPDLPKDDKSVMSTYPTSVIYPDMGWATMRNSWGNNATMLAVKGGLTWNHSHADAGSYILFYKGKNIIMDSGNSSYGNPLYTKYYCQSQAHNVVLWNGKGEETNSPYFGSVNHASLHNLLDAGDFKYLLADATGPYSRILSRNYRSFLWVGDVILVYDDLLSYEPGKFEWLLHYNGESKRRGEDLSIKDGDAEVFVRPLFPETFPSGGLPHDFPEKMTLESRVGYKDHHPEEKINYWSVSSSLLTDRTKFITSITLKNDINKDNLPQIERFDGKNFLGVRITQNGKVTEIYFNLLADGSIKHRNSIITMNGWETDAYIVALTFEEGTDKSKTSNLKNLFVTHGSYVRRDGQVLIHSLSKFTADVKSFNTLPNIIIQGQDNSAFSVYSKSSVSSVQVNDQKQKGKYDADLKLLKLKLQ